MMMSSARRAHIRMASERWVEGLIFVAAEDNIDKLHELEVAGIPAVAIDRLPEGYTGPVVTLDNREAGRLAAEHLISLGHTRIAHISGPLRLRLARERLEGFRTTLEASGLRVDAVAGGMAIGSARMAFSPCRNCWRGRRAPRPFFAPMTVWPSAPSVPPLKPACVCQRICR